MVIPRPIDSIEKVEGFFNSVRRQADVNGKARMTARAFRDQMMAVPDLDPSEHSAVERWYCSKIRG